MPTRAASFCTSLVLCPVSFFLGILFSNSIYDIKTLWIPNAPELDFIASKTHYLHWANSPNVCQHTLHVIIAIGLLGIIAKLYKPSEANKLFDGASLVLYMIGIVVYGVNIVRGLRAVVSGEWGDVDENMGINVMAASQIILVMVFLGVLGLQLGQYYAEYQDEVTLKQFYAQEKEEERQREEKEKAGKKNKEQKTSEESDPVLIPSNSTSSSTSTPSRDTPRSKKSK